MLKILGDHPRINRLKGVHEDGLLLEYQPNGSVERYLQSHPDTSEGIAYMHAKGVFQGDVSVGNLLLDSELSIKLCDFQGKLLDGRGSVILDGRTAERIMSSMSRPDLTYIDRKTDMFAFEQRSSSLSLVNYLSQISTKTRYIEGSRATSFPPWSYSLVETSYAIAGWGRIPMPLR